MRIPGTVVLAILAAPGAFALAPALLFPTDAPAPILPAGDVLIQAFNYHYNPPVALVQVDELVTFEVIESCHSANLELGTAAFQVVEDDGGAECAPGTPGAPPEDGVILQVRFTSTGVWEYFCDQPLHRFIGMQGLIVVTAP